MAMRPKTQRMILKSLNLALTFFLELAMLAALAYAGFQIASPLKFVVGIGAPLLAILIWGRFLAPKSPSRLTGSAYLIAKFTLFGIATVETSRLNPPALAPAQSPAALRPASPPRT